MVRDVQQYLAFLVTFNVFMKVEKSLKYMTIRFRPVSAVYNAFVNCLHSSPINVLLQQRFLVLGTADLPAIIER
jgi:hypothetical protein